jgi:hypothetical protein
MLLVLPLKLVEQEVELLLVRLHGGVVFDLIKGALVLLRRRNGDFDGVKRRIDPLLLRFASPRSARI